MQELEENFCLKPGYISRDASKYFDHVLPEKTHTIHQPYVYEFAAHLARRFNCSHIIDLGCGHARKLVALHPGLKTIGVDFGENLEYCRSHYPFASWINFDLDKDGLLVIDPEIVARSVVVSSDVIEHLVDPTNLLRVIQSLLIHSPAAVLSTPERDLLRGVDDIGPPANPSHVREWNLTELLLLLKGFNVSFAGLTINNDRALKKKTTIVVLENNHLLKPGKTPKDFRPVALVVTRNDEDVIGPSVEYLINQGLEAYLIDLKSVDSTVRLAQEFCGRHLIGVERLDLTDLDKPDCKRIFLEHLERISLRIKADWVVCCRANQWQKSPWPNQTLKNAISYVDQRGYNSIDHSVITCRLDDSSTGAGFENEVDHPVFDFVKSSNAFIPTGIWKNLRQSLQFTGATGCDISFEGQRLFPYRFLQWQGANSAFVTSQLKLESGSSREESFNSTYLVERLSGILPE